MSRLHDLVEVRDGLQERMRQTTSDQNYAMLSRTLVDVLKQIEELDPASRAKPVETGHSRFMEKLSARRAG